MSEHVCAVCDFPTTRLRRFAQHGDECVDLRRCPRCELECLWPQPSAAWLAEIYADYAALRSGGGALPKSAYFDELLGRFAGELAGARVLELGSAEGECTAALLARWPDARVTALDAHAPSSPTAAGPPGATASKGASCDAPRTLAISVDQWLAERHRDRFDRLLAFDLLEHLADPLRSLRALVERHLAEGGRILATFPNVESLSHHLVGALWHQYKPEHLFYFSGRSITRLEEACALERIHLAPLTKRLPLGYLARVAAHSGPGAARALGRGFERVLPEALAGLRVPLRGGEWLWIAQRRA